MRRLKYLNRANTDLRCLCQFLAAENIASTQNAFKEIAGALTALSPAPKIGRPVEKGFRKCIINFCGSSHLAHYDFDK